MWGQCKRKRTMECSIKVTRIWLASQMRSVPGAVATGFSFAVLSRLRRRRTRSLRLPVLDLMPQSSNHVVNVLAHSSANGIKNFLGICITASRG